MIRPFTLVTMVLAALSGAYLFAVKHRAQVLGDQLASVTEASRADEQRIAVLQAQWSADIDHSRLQGLAAQFSGLSAMKPSQLVSLAQLAQALPPAGSAAPVEISVPAVAMPVVAVAADVAAALPLPPPLPPPVAPEAAPVARVVLASAELAAPRKRIFREAARVAAKKAFLGGAELAENLPVARVAAMPVAVNAASVEDSGQGGSMLGMAADLAPPQPLAAPVGFGTSN